jgi:hypothetical protein
MDSKKIQERARTS